MTCDGLHQDGLRQQEGKVVKILADERGEVRQPATR